MYCPECVHLVGHFEWCSYYDPYDDDYMDEEEYEEREAIAEEAKQKFGG